MWDDFWYLWKSTILVGIVVCGGLVAYGLFGCSVEDQKFFFGLAIAIGLPLVTGVICGIIDTL